MVELDMHHRFAPLHIHLLAMFQEIDLVVDDLVFLHLSSGHRRQTSKICMFRSHEDLRVRMLCLRSQSSHSVIPIDRYPRIEVNFFLLR